MRGACSLGFSANVHRQTSRVLNWFPYISHDYSELISFAPHESCEFVELTVVSHLMSIMVSLLPVRGWAQIQE